MRNFLYLLALTSFNYSFSAQSAEGAAISASISAHMEESGSLRGVAIARECCNALFNFEEIQKTAEIYAFLTNRGENINDLNDAGEIVPVHPANSFKKYLSQFNFSPDQVTSYVVREGEKATLFAMDVFDMAFEQEQKKISAMDTWEQFEYFNDSTKLASMTHWLHLTMPKRPRNDYETILDRIRIMASENYWHLYNLNVKLENPETWSRETFAFYGAFSHFDDPCAHEILRVCLQVLTENASTFWESFLSKISQYQSVSFNTENIRSVLALHPIFNPKLGLIDVGSSYKEYLIAIFKTINGLRQDARNAGRFRSPEILERIRKLSALEIGSLFPPTKKKSFSALVGVLAEIRQTIFGGRTAIIHYINFAKSLKDAPESSLSIPSAIQERANLLEQGILDANHTLDCFKEELQKLREEKAKLEEQISTRLEKEKTQAESEALQERIRVSQAQEEAKEKALKKAQAALKSLEEEQDRRKREAAERRSAWKAKVAAYRSRSSSKMSSGGGKVKSQADALDDFLVDGPIVQRPLSSSEQPLVNTIFKITPINYEEMLALFGSLGFKVEETNVGHKVSISGTNPKMKSFHRPHPGTDMEDFRGLKAAKELLAFAGYMPE